MENDVFPLIFLEQRLVKKEIAHFEEELKAVGVRKLPFDYVIESFKDIEWIDKHDYDWLLECYQYLRSYDNDNDLTGCPVVPVVVEGKLRWSCDNEQPIYFECDDNIKQILASVPEFVRVPLAFLKQDFLERIVDDSELRKWMTKTLNVYNFSKDNYAIDVSNWLRDNYEHISESDLVYATVFLSQFQDMYDKFKDIPVLLSDGSCRLSYKLNDENSLFSTDNIEPQIKAVATPINLDHETGWQNIFVSYEDRKHLVWLSGAYIELNKTETIKKLQKLWEKLGVRAYPPPVIFEGHGNDSSLNHYEEVCFKKTHRSNYSRKIKNYRPFSVISSFNDYSKEEKNKISFSLVKWINQTPIKSWAWTKVSYFFYSWKSELFCSELLVTLKNKPWLCTTKGFCKPSETFIFRAEIKEILGDSVPYFEGELSEDAVRQLGIRTETTVEELISVLEQSTLNKSGSKDLACRIYRTLDSRELESDVIDRLCNNNIIFIPSDSESKWATPAEVIWEDRSNILGNDFVYLESLYPDLKDFFVKKLKVKEDVDNEVYANYWLKLQEKPGNNKEQIENKLNAIYREIRTICQMNEEDRPDWWKSFLSKAKIWTQDKSFEKPSQVYVPDDGNLREIFKKNKNISFAWRPQKDSFNYWSIVYKTFHLPFLSDSVIANIAEYKEDNVIEKPKFLTKSAKILILTWIKEKSEIDYQRLLDNKIVNVLCDTNEVIVSSLQVNYQLNNFIETISADSFWDKDKKILFILKGKFDFVKNPIAHVLARALMSNRAYRDLAVWIELVLGSDNSEFRIKQNSWRIPDEVKYLIDDKPLQLEQYCPLKTEDDPIINTRKTDHQVVILNGTETSIEKPSMHKDKTDQVMAVQITENHRLQNNIENESMPEYPSRPSSSPDRRAERKAKQYSNLQDVTREKRERNVRTSKTNLDPRYYLQENYKNIDGVLVCQLCQEGLDDRSVSFEKKDGGYYFEAVEMFKNLPKEDEANKLLLCPLCSAKYTELVKKDANQLDKLKKAILEMERNTDEELLEFPVQLNNEEKKLRFVQQHFIDLQAILQKSDENTGNNSLERVI
ncbi:hypothetical protein SMSP2_00397 [Limihaloglobus sulfuriphilus]|uniref:Uncharacterized protein n=1 Tax=Limihaloglobus sulfuriphilus TaxID=1851148 RepID=A0A1Q2MBL9_9BACT|nr:hypothetical protein [Limihaloglobus sulfuriphilus]AQQ70059.1 hypothetical protein SMSP2_00397 [Limihaloglobus sulfuriphilus]